MNFYRKGANGERKAKALLEHDGYTCVRSAKSGGMFDVVAWNATRLRLVQVKTGQSCAISSADRVAMITTPGPVGTSRELWWFKPHARIPTITVFPFVSKEEWERLRQARNPTASAPAPSGAAS